MRQHDTTSEQFRAWLESRPHVSYCGCPACLPNASREIEPLEDRLKKTCPGCGNNSIGEDGVCTVCGAKKGRSSP